MPFEFRKLLVDLDKLLFKVLAIYINTRLDDKKVRGLSANRNLTKRENPSLVLTLQTF